jgi:hypothetical protein
LSYEVHHMSHCFVSHSFCLLNHFEALESSCLPMSISKLMFYVCVSKLFVHESVSRFYILVCLKAFVCICLFQSSCLPILCLKALICLCLRQSFCLPMYFSNLLSIIICSHEFWKVYEFWSSSQTWFILPYNICKSESKVMNFQALQSSSSMCHILFTWVFEFLNSLHVTMCCLPQIVHKYFKVLKFETLQSSSFIC